MWGTKEAQYWDVKYVSENHFVKKKKKNPVGLNTFYFLPLASCGFTKLVQLLSSIFILITLTGSENLMKLGVQEPFG